MSRATDRPWGLSRLLSTCLSLVVGCAEAVAFWAAIALPFVYVGGYLLTYALPTLALPSTPEVAVLLGVNLLALVVGHRYGGIDGETERDARPAINRWSQRSD